MKTDQTDKVSNQKDKASQRTPSAFMRSLNKRVK